MFKDLVLNYPNDSSRMHKYQHPLLISAKRLCHEAACFTGIASVGQLLNIMDDKKTAMSKILTLDEHLRLEMQFFVRHAGFTPDEELVYLRSRLTYWLFHQLLKGTNNNNNNNCPLFSSVGRVVNKRIFTWSQQGIILPF